MWLIVFISTGLGGGNITQQLLTSNYSFYIMLVQISFYMTLYDVQILSISGKTVLGKA